MRLLISALVFAFAACIASLAPLQAQSVRPASAGAISGVVLDGTTHLPLVGALVALGSPTRIQTTRPLRQVTDAAGRFVFTGLPALDAYSLTATRSGYADATFGPPTTTGDNKRIVLAEGQWFADANIIMWKFGSIAGRVTDERGEPVVGAYVRVLPPLLIAGTTRLTGGTMARTDDRGEYRIPDLAPGKYFVMVPTVQNTVPADATVADVEGMTADALATRQAEATNNNWTLSLRNKGVLDVTPDARLIIGNYPMPPLGADGRLQAYPTVFYPGVLSVTDAAPIELGRGESKAAIDLALSPVRTASVSGRVEGMPAPFSGFVVRLVPQGLEDLATEAATAALTADGRFTFLNVPAGSYAVDANQSATALETMGGVMVPWPPGSAVASSGGFPITAGPPGVSATQHGRSNRYYGRAPVSVGLDDVAAVVVFVRKGVTVSGRIVVESGTAPPPANLNPALWRPTLEPATGDPSLILPRTNGAPDPGAPPGNRSPDSFSIEGVQPGEYVLGLTGGFLRPYAIRSMTMDGREIPAERFLVSDTNDINTIVLTLTDRIPKLSGIVAGLEPTKPAAVIAFPVDQSLRSRYGLTPIRIRSVGVTTAGRYEFANLPAGDYFVVAVDASQRSAWQDPAFFESAVRAATRVTLGWGDTKIADVGLMGGK